MTKKKKKKQLGFFSPRKVNAFDAWKNMPEFKVQHEPKPVTTATFKFETEEDFQEFNNKLLEHKIFEDKKIFSKQANRECWYPQKRRSPHFEYVNDQTEKEQLPRFPVYIISKGRFEVRPTADMLEKLGIPYFIIVEKEEYKQYKAVVKGKVLVLPKKYKKNYDVFWKDDDPRTGPGAARNFAWDHSIENGHDWHYVLDDNIQVMMRFNNNLKIKCRTPSIFCAMEDFVLRYENIAVAGPHYSFFIAEKTWYAPYVANTRIFSFLLIRNDIPYRWRGRYSEDVDLSLRVLKDGWCTVQFNAFLQRKMPTQVCRGGNSAEFYDKKEGTYLKSKMIVDMHPDCAYFVKRYGRDHHYVDFRKFKGNKLKLKPGLNLTDKPNEFGMQLKDLVKG